MLDHFKTPYQSVGKAAAAAVNVVQNEVFAEPSLPSTHTSPPPSQGALQHPKPTTLTLPYLQKQALLDTSKLPPTQKLPSQEVRARQQRLAFRAGVGGGRVIRIGGGDSNAGERLAADDLEHVFAAPHAALYIQVLPGQQLGCHGAAVQQRLLLQAMKC